MAAESAMSAEIQSNPPTKPHNHNTKKPKNKTKNKKTPTTTTKNTKNNTKKKRTPWVDSTSGPPARMNANEGKKVIHVTTAAATAPPRNKASGPNGALT